MKMKIPLCAYTLLAVPVCARAQARPDAAEQKVLTDKIQRTALRFRGQLPDFIAAEQETRWEAFGSGKWKQHDLLEMLVYFGRQGQTGIKLLSIDGKPTRKEYRRAGGVIDTAYLGGAILPIALFAPIANPRLQWSGWRTLADKRVAVLSFTAQPVVKNYPDGKHGYPIGFHGLVFADPSEGMPLRIEAHVDPPPGYPFQDSGWDADYGPVNISGRELMLPVKGTTYVTRGKNRAKNELTFTGYRKYEADSTVTFDN